MSTFCCPNCQMQALLAMDEPNRFACMHCRHIWTIIDVLAQAVQDASLLDRCFGEGEADAEISRRLARTRNERRVNP
jgi:hypothetical protein